MLKNLSKGSKAFFKEPQWEKVRGILWFLFITLIIHLLWRFWANSLNFVPITGFMMKIRTFLEIRVYEESVFVCKKILKINILQLPDYSIIVNNIKLIFSKSASGMKQMLQFALLILVIPGPWKHKAWFIPLGIVIVHLTNVFRVICLIIVAFRWPQQIQYAHDNYLRLLFYIVIFGLWIFWVEKIRPLKPDSKP